MSAAPVGNCHLFCSTAGERTVGFVQLQLNLLHFHEGGANLSERERRLLFTGVIVGCSKYGEGAEALALFREALKNNVFVNHEEQFLKVITRAYYNLVEKGFRDKAFQLYKEAVESEYNWPQTGAKM